MPHICLVLFEAMPYALRNRVVGVPIETSFGSFAVGDVAGVEASRHSLRVFKSKCVAKAIKVKSKPPKAAASSKVIKVTAIDVSLSCFLVFNSVNEVNVRDNGLTFHCK